MSGLHLSNDDGAGQECCPRSPGQDLMDSIKESNHFILQVFSENVRTKARDLKREKRRAEGLVYQMLPRSLHVTLNLNPSHEHPVSSSLNLISPLYSQNCC